MAIWYARCHRCHDVYEHPDTTEEKPGDAFCPSCKGQCIASPVLNWTRLPAGLKLVAS